MSVVYPSREWMEALVKKVNSDERFKTVGATFEAEFLLVVLLDEEALKDYQIPEKMAGLISILKMLPPEKWAKFKGRPEEKFVEKLGLKLDEILRDPSIVDRLDINELARRLASVKLEEIQGAGLSLYMEIKRGEIKRFEPVAPGEKTEARFKIIGGYSAFKQVVQGKADLIQLIASGKLKFQGDLSYVMRHLAAIKRFSDLMASIPVR
jgi:putative sterol carrier protein